MRRYGQIIGVKPEQIAAYKQIHVFAINNTNSAAKAADLLGTALNGTGNIAIVEFVPGSATNDQRVNGFKQELSSQYPRVKIVAELVLQNPFKMGYDSVKALVHQLRDGVKATTEDTGVTFVTPDNLTSPQIVAALTPTCANQTS